MAKQPPRSATATRVAAVRRLMAKADVDALIVRSTDRYLNEYVPEADSARIWISGFTGSMGDVVIGPKRAYLVVDGRYWIQAEQEIDPAVFEVVKVPFATSTDDAIAGCLRTIAEAHAKLAAARSGHDRHGGRSGPAKAGRALRVGFEPDRITPLALDRLGRSLGKAFELRPIFPSPIEVARGEDRPPAPASRIRVVDERRLGRSVEDKLAELAQKMGALGIDALLVQKLDEIAYLSNLRGDQLPYQATFKSIALATPNALLLAIEGAAVPDGLAAARPAITLLPEAELWRRLGAKKKLRVGYDRLNNTEQARLAIEARGARAIAVESPIGAMKARKNPAELKAMTAAFARADRVVDESAAWLCRAVVGGKRVTEADFADEVRARFERSGATGLSFRIISAAGKNGAIVHYSHPSRRRVLKAGELMLLDTGAYYEEGYATDLTRTFLIGPARARGTDEQRRYYTLVLRAAIAGMTAVLPRGARGHQLDALVRAPLWAAGLNFNHGTGHGVGINVHEFPPRIGSEGSVLEEGFVFSIEPGVYLPSFGGIRIENLCTIEPAPKLDGFVRVMPLTYAPLDRRLIEPALLLATEKAWLADYARRYPN